MKIVLAGGSGFLGSALADALEARGERVSVLSRGARAPHGTPEAPSRLQWDPDGTLGPWAREVDGADAVVNLAGAGMADKRWSDARKRELVESRVLATRSIAVAIRQAARPPAVLLNASGVGIYPDSDAVADEGTPPGTGFLADLGQAWEAEARRAESERTRVVLLRSGVVFHRDGGALGQMLLPFRLGAGGPMGSGRQWWAWIHRDDWVRMTIWALDSAAVRGPLNVCAPEPATNREIGRAIGRALRRPAILPAPAFALTLALGEMAEHMLLASQRAMPARARDLGFVWSFPDLDAAVSDAVGRPNGLR